MYSHGQVWDATPDEGEPRMIEVGNAIEAVKHDPARYFPSKEAAERAAEKAKPVEPAPEPNPKFDGDAS